MKELTFAILLLITLFTLNIHTTTANKEGGVMSHEDEESDEESFPGLKDGGCYTTKCSTYSFCKQGYQELRVDKRTCPRGGQERKICCKQVDGCLDTICEAHTPRCPGGTKEFARDMVVCESRAPVMTTLHCCNEGHNPPCFNTSCSTGGGVIGRGEGCPEEYHEVDGGQGEEWGCPRDANYVYGRKTCCLPQKEEEEEADDEENVGSKTGIQFWIVLFVTGITVGLSK